MGTWKGATTCNLELTWTKAIGQGDTEAVRFLLERGARMNLRDANGDTALDVAIEEGNTLVSTLIEEHQVHLLRVKADRENEIAAQARQAQERINEEKNRLAYLKVEEINAQLQTERLLEETMQQCTSLVQHRGIYSTIMTLTEILGRLKGEPHYGADSHTITSTISNCELQLGRFYDELAPGASKAILGALCYTTAFCWLQRK
ncbi:hypothetical protein CYMTET_24961 [Cymbomonas tetramitiformis]|uniref:Ankyrin repeat protein n=1 Tax=Cymbomonas tetramitiformis TaxID=36881 RepID=A0AAE0FUS8_9CHLO|nr:hypothetical protein CYMTET_24961 [Cymbomonas tetramitiformis]